MNHILFSILTSHALVNRKRRKTFHCIQLGHYTLKVAVLIVLLQIPDEFNIGGNNNICYSDILSTLYLFRHQINSALIKVHLYQYTLRSI